MYFLTTFNKLQYFRDGNTDSEVQEWIEELYVLYQQKYGELETPNYDHLSKGTDGKSELEVDGSTEADVPKQVDDWLYVFLMENGQYHLLEKLQNKLDSLPEG